MKVVLTIEDYKETPRGKNKIMLTIEHDKHFLSKSTDAHRVAMEAIDLIDKKRREINA